MGSVREYSARLFDQHDAVHREHPFTSLFGFEEYGPGLGFVSSFANVVALDTDEGVVLVDTGSFVTGAAICRDLRKWTQAPVHTAVYTHGHVDHVTGIAYFLDEDRPRGARPLHVIAHRAIRDRFDRYVLTNGYNAQVNARQFRSPGLGWPTRYRYPDQVYDDQFQLQVGGETLELHHGRGETDDHTWLWIPSKRALCTGDLFIWASPNCGNPQKAQRYPREWAEALKAMAALAPLFLFPGHGPPIEGEDRVRGALLDSARYLDSIVDQTLALMNAGEPLHTIVDQVRPPADLANRPYLQPIYDEPAFIVRNIWRLYGGWWGGDPTELKPASPDSLGVEVARAAGGAGKLMDRALSLSGQGEHALACHLADWAARATPNDKSMREGRARVFRARAEQEGSLMAQGVFHGAADEGPR